MSLRFFTSGEGGKKVSPKNLRAASQEPEYSNRFASFASVTLNPDFNFLGPGSL